MQQIAQLIEKFNNGTATAEEQLQLQAALQQQEPALQQWMKEAYEKDSTNSPALLSAERSASLFRDIQARVAPAAWQAAEAPVVTLEAPVRRWYQRSMVWSAAASLLVITVLAVLFTQRPHPAQPLTVQNAPVAPAALPKQIHNNGRTLMHLVLEDHSTIELHPGSSLTYIPGFTATARTIQLTGRALFTVAANKKRPFTVTAAGIATTALGTQFLVNAQDAGNVIVKLLEGKVVVQSADSSLAQTMQPVYLLPGQEAVASLQHHLCKVRQSSNRLPEAAAPAPAGDAMAFHYNRTPLIQVLQQLGSRYQVQFQYNKREIQTLRFTGTLEQGDSLEVILNILGATNNLSFTQNGSNIVITKQP